MAITFLRSEHFPFLPVFVTIRGQTRTVEALIDTGFDGDLAIPPGLLANGPPPDGFAAWELADGSRVRSAVYAGTLRLGTLASIPADIIALGAEPIVGRGVTDRYGVYLDHGERVIVEL